MCSSCFKLISKVRCALDRLLPCPSNCKQAGKASHSTICVFLRKINNNTDKLHNRTEARRPFGVIDEIIYQSKLWSIETNLYSSISPWTSKPELCSKDQGMGLTGLCEGTNTPCSQRGTNPAPSHQLSGEKSSWSYSFNEAERGVSSNHVSSDLQWKKPPIFRSNIQGR